jgi:hypothetical protein
MQQLVLHIHHTASGVRAFPTGAENIQQFRIALVLFASGLADIHMIAILQLVEVAACKVHG